MPVFRWYSWLRWFVTRTWNGKDTSSLGGLLQWDGFSLCHLSPASRYMPFTSCLSRKELFTRYCILCPFRIDTNSHHHRKLSHQHNSSRHPYNSFVYFPLLFLEAGDNVQSRSGSKWSWPSHRHGPFQEPSGIHQLSSSLRIELSFRVKEWREEERGREGERPASERE